jgi:hypothetical protein
MLLMDNDLTDSKYQLGPVAIYGEESQKLDLDLLGLNNLYSPNGET